VGHAVSFFKSAAGAAVISAALWTATGSRPSAATVSGNLNICRGPLAVTARTFARLSLFWSIIRMNGYILAAAIIYGTWIGNTILGARREIAELKGDVDKLREALERTGKS
jgi:hypothetical protein